MWSYFAIGEDTGRDDLVRSKGLPRIDKGGENLASLFTFIYRPSVPFEQSVVAVAEHTPQ